MRERAQTIHFSYIHIIWLLVFFLVVGSLSARTVKVGLYENAPKIFTDSSGEPAGIFVDIIEYIAQREGWQVEYVQGSWDDGLARLSKGEIDLMPDVAISKDRENVYSFHKIPVLSSWSQVFARQGSGINSLLDLNGKRIAVLEGSVQKDAFLERVKGFEIEVKILSYKDFEHVLEAVEKRKADAAIVNNFFGMMHAEKYKLEDTAIVFNPTILFFATPKNKDLDLLSAIDKHLKELKKDSNSIYYRSMKRWVSQEVHFKIPDWVKILGVAIFVALIVSLIAGFVLKHQVKMRTQELTISNMEMEIRIQVRTAELAAAMEQAKAADSLKSAFLATMSHELRTPLNSIIGFTGILLQELAGPLNAEQKKQLSMVQNSSRHLLSLINDVLDISKIEAGQLDLCYETFDLRESILHTTKLIYPLVEKKGIELRINISDKIGQIYSDKRRLEQIIINLLSNAVKFTEQGFVRLDCQPDENICHLSVKDSGIGFKTRGDPNAISTLFTSGYRVDQKV